MYSISFVLGGILLLVVNVGALYITFACNDGHSQCPSGNAYEIQAGNQSFQVCAPQTCSYIYQHLNMFKCECSTGRCYFLIEYQACSFQQILYEEIWECGPCSIRDNCETGCLTIGGNQYCNPWAQCPFSRLVSGIKECSNLINGSFLNQTCQTCSIYNIEGYPPYPQLSYFSLCSDNLPFDGDQFDKLILEQFWNVQESWTDLCKEGLSQSPINIDPRGIEVCRQGDFNFIQIKCYLLDFLSGQGVTYAIEAQDALMVFLNTESDGQIVRAATSSTKIQFHHPSEHTVRGQAYDLQMQIFTQLVDRALWEQIIEQSSVFDFIKQSPQELFTNMNSGEYVSPNQAIISLLFTVSEDAESWLNEKGLINIKNLLKCASGDLFYRYTGSLTVPPCTQGVQWFVSRRPLKILPSQFSQISAALIANNSRSTQDLNGRKLRIGGSPCH